MAGKKLALYNKKRDFKKTAEPAGKLSHSASGFRYLIQKHAASRLHYDFRLELDGVLKSWAVTRGPSIDPHDKRLAVEVEDHPVSYGDFEGVIPNGEYGGGTVMLWDEGSWEPIGDPRQSLKKGSLHFILHGKRLKGEWTLVRMKDRAKDKGRHNWLLIKRSDTHAQPGEAEKFLEKHASSVVSKRQMDAIAQDADRVWGKKSAAQQTAQTAPAKISSRTPKHPKKTKLPGFIKPELATLVTQMPIGPEWVHEIKFDGYRVLTYIDKGNVRMYTRNGLDWTEKFGELPEQLARLKLDNAILDGELVALNAQHTSSFSTLKDALSEGGHGLSYYLFDLLHLNGHDMRIRPLLERKKALQALVPNKKLQSIFYSEHFLSTDDSFFQSACSLQLEGVISKQADAPYRSGRGGDWLKSKCHKRQEFVIGGYTPSSTGSPMIGSLLLGYYEKGEFVYAGRVGTGFDQKMATTLYKMLKKLTRKTMAYTKYSDAGRRGPGWKRGVIWVEPKLVCEVEFTEWTTDGALRHPSFQGLREDKAPNTITRDIPVSPKRAAHKTAAAPPAPKTKTTHHTNEDTNEDDVILSHPEKILFPDQGYTKQELADYYQQVSDWILPYIAGRALSLVRCPSGSGKSCFFQRHADQGLSSHLDTVQIGSKGHAPYLVIKDVQSLQALVQMGVLEIHSWGSRTKQWDKPDYVVFDLDPDPSVPFTDVKKAAHALRARLQKIKLESFVKTTGGKGLHVVVPCRPTRTWDEVKTWARQIAEQMEAASPEHFTTNMRKEKRKGRIFIDYLRNSETATAIAPYSSRARDGAPVAVPLTWAELGTVKSGNQWTIKTLPRRLQKLTRDPWEAFFTTKQTLPKP